MKTLVVAGGGEGSCFLSRVLKISYKFESSSESNLPSDTQFLQSYKICSALICMTIVVIKVLLTCINVIKSNLNKTTYDTNLRYMSSRQIS